MYKIEGKAGKFSSTLNKLNKTKNRINMYKLNNKWIKISETRSGNYDPLISQLA